jgi:excinuclease UvrABC nuclease subunit
MAFLAGRNLTAITILERDMAAAAAGLAFERAASLRDKVDALRWLTFQLQRVRTAQMQLSLVYCVKDSAGKDLWYLICQGRVAGAIPMPLDATGRQGAVRLIETVFQRHETKLSPLPVDVIDQVLLVAGWFRKNPEERSRAMTPSSALEWCRRQFPQT